MNSSWKNELGARLDGLKSAGLERTLRTASGRGVELSISGRPVCSFASNDYLGLSQHPDVIRAAKASLDQSGAGATASRLICGTKPEHVELECALANFKRTEAALVFPSGYQAAQAAILALCGTKSETSKPVRIFLDRLAHASLVDGAMLAKEFGGARVRTFKHNDVEDLKELLSADDSRALVITESLFSMDGDMAPLKELYAVTHAVGALLFVDEAHGTGVLGTNGAGELARHFSDRLPDDVISMGTLSKALGSQGGFIAASKLVIDSIIHIGRSFLFTTGLAPCNAAAALAAVTLLNAGKLETQRTNLLARSEALRAELSAQGWEIVPGYGPIIPLLVGEEALTVEIFSKLLEAGYWVPAVRFPTVGKGKARLRLSLSAVHTETHIKELVAELKRSKGS